VTANFELSLWQRKQAALLYHFASYSYLQGLQQRLHELMQFAGMTLDLAKKKNRDSVLVDARWGSRNTGSMPFTVELDGRRGKW